jgi:hypothetical protein
MVSSEADECGPISLVWHVSYVSIFLSSAHPFSCLSAHGLGFLDPMASVLLLEEGRQREILGGCSFHFETLGEVECYFSRRLTSHDAQTLDMTSLGLLATIEWKPSY